MRPRPNDIERIAEQAWLIAGGNPTKDSKFTRPQIDSLVRMAISKLFQTRIFDFTKVEGQWNIPGEFIVTFPGVVVQYDTTLLQYYIQSPTQYVNLPSGKGLLSIMPTPQEGQPYPKPFIPVPPNAYAFTDTRENSYLQGQIGYIVEGPKVKFIGGDVNNKFKNANITSVVVKVITGDAPDEDLMIPSDMEGDIIDWVLQRLKETGNTDQADDNVDKT